MRLREPVDELLLKVLTSQRAMEERFLHLEELRVQRDLELEERRVQLEQRRLELEREHEFRMFGIFAQMLTILKQGFCLVPGPAAPVPWDPRGARTPQGPEQTSRTFSGLGNPGTIHPQGSAFLSIRGNDIKFRHGFSDEGRSAYYADQYDEDKNPTVSRAVLEAQG